MYFFWLKIKTRSLIRFWWYRGWWQSFKPQSCLKNYSENKPKPLSIETNASIIWFGRSSWHKNISLHLLSVILCHILTFSMQEHILSLLFGLVCIPFLFPLCQKSILNLPVSKVCHPWTCIAKRCWEWKDVSTPFYHPLFFQSAKIRNSAFPVLLSCDWQLHN